MSTKHKNNLGGYVSWAFLYFHIFIFIGINALLIVTNNLISPDQPWYIIPLSCWGLFLFGHFILHFFVQSESARSWREIQTEKLSASAEELGLDQMEIQRRAKVVVFCWMSFYFHLSVYFGCSLMMLLINYLTFPDKHWSLIVTTSWGIWVLIHYILVFLGFSNKLSSWRNNKIKSFIYNKNLPKKEALHEATFLFGFWLVFRLHLILYLLANTLLINIDLIFNKQSQHWYLFPLIGWGVIISAHWLLTFLIISPRLAQWRINRTKTIH